MYYANNREGWRQCLADAIYQYGITGCKARVFRAGDYWRWQRIADGGTNWRMSLY